jgi:hypothetical protein
MKTHRNNSNRSTKSNSSAGSSPSADQSPAASISKLDADYWRTSGRLWIQQTPENFRDNIGLHSNHDVPLVGLLQPWQLRDLQALDPGWLHLAGLTPPPGSTLLRRAYIERPRGHSKTFDMAVQIAWILIAARRTIRGLAAAADREQGLLIPQAVERLARLNPQALGELEFLESAIRNNRTKSRLDVLSSDVASSYGVLPDFVVCDELSHWPKPELWQSLLSSAAKQRHCILTVLTNAGVGRGWQWGVREHARTSPLWHFSSLDGPQAPWITAEWLEEQRKLLPPAVYARLWLNQWQHSDGEFVTLAEASGCCDDSLTPQLAGSGLRSYVASIDYAEKRDLTVGCICHLEGRRVIVDRMDVVRPDQDHPTPVAWVEDWIHRTAQTFGDVRFILDEYQLLAVIQRWEAVYSIERFRFAGGQGNYRLARLLRQLILDRDVAWYPGCGQIAGETDRDDLATELSSLIVRERPDGAFRIDHRQDQHDDRSFALGAACLALIEQPPETPLWQIGE